MTPVWWPRCRGDGWRATTPRVRDDSCVHPGTPPPAFLLPPYLQGASLIGAFHEVDRWPDSPLTGLNCFCGGCKGFVGLHRLIGSLAEPSCPFTVASSFPALLGLSPPPPPPSGCVWRGFAARGHLPLYKGITRTFCREEWARGQLAVVVVECARPTEMRRRLWETSTGRAVDRGRLSVEGDLLPLLLAFCLPELTGLSIQCYIFVGFFWMKVWVRSDQVTGHESIFLSLLFLGMWLRYAGQWHNKKIQLNII